MSAVQILREDPSSIEFKPLETALHAWEIRRSDPKESYRLAQELVEHALEFDDPLVTAWAYLTCGAHELAANEFEQAGETVDSAIRLFSRTGEKRGESLAVILRGRVYFGMSEFHSALGTYKSVIEREAHGLQTLERFEAFNAIAGCFWGMDKVELSLLYLSKAFDTLRNTSHNTERATVLSNMGAALVWVGNYEAAREFLVQAVIFGQQVGDRTLSYNILVNLLACHIELAEISAGVMVAHRLLTDFEDIAFGGPQNSGLCNAAIVFALAKKWQLSEHCLVGAQIIAEQSDLPMPRIGVAQAEATIEEARGKFGVAAAHAETLLASSDQHISTEMRYQVYSLLVRCYQKISRVDEMLTYKKKRLVLSENRYAAGLAAAMVILDFKASLKQISI